MHVGRKALASIEIMGAPLIAPVITEFAIAVSSREIAKSSDDTLWAWCFDMTAIDERCYD